jgi:FkbM family methyltransferase
LTRSVGVLDECSNVASLKVDRWKLISRNLRRTILRDLIYRPPGDDFSQCPSFCSHRDLIGIEVLCSGSFECEFLELSRSIVFDHIADNNWETESRVALDIGANIGTHALSFSTLVDRVLAFEPNRPVALVCQANALAAGADNIEVFNIALSDRAGTASLSVPRSGNFGWASLEIARPDRPPVAVRTERGDDFIIPRINPGERVVLVKVDVEGHEPSVFKGLTAILQQHRPVVIFETLSSAHLAACRKVLEPLGYPRFDAVQKDWENRGYAGKLFALLSGKTGIQLIPAETIEDRFYSAVVARPATAAFGSADLNASARPPLADDAEHEHRIADDVSAPQSARLAQEAK